MTCLLNEEIRAIQCTISQLSRGIALEGNQKKRNELKQRKKELEEMLDVKLGVCNEY